MQKPILTHYTDIKDTNLESRQEHTTIQIAYKSVFATHRFPLTTSSIKQVQILARRKKHVSISIRGWVMNEKKKKKKHASIDFYDKINNWDLVDQIIYPRNPYFVA